MVLANKDWFILCDAAGEPMSLEDFFTLDRGSWSLGSYFLFKDHGVEDAPVEKVMQMHVKSGLEAKCPTG